MIRSMLFFPEKYFYEKPEDYGLLAEDVFFQTADRVRLHGWFLKTPAPSSRFLLFFHGNAGNISGRLQKAKGWVELGFSVLLVDYRGYGRSEGMIERGEDILTDARAAWEYLSSGDDVQIILYGESLGTHPAIVLAGEQKAAGLVLEAPFTSFVDLASVHYPFVPKGLLKNFEFSNLGPIEKIQCPLFILHGTQDKICPFTMARKLFEKAPAPKEFLEIPGGTHNDLPSAAGRDFWQKPFEFIAKNLR